MFKTVMTALLLVSVGGCTWMASTEVISRYRWEKAYANYWSLADKSSTIPAKQKYIDQFVTALEAGAANGQFSTHDAIWLKTANNEFASNLRALKTLKDRLSQIQDMDPNSFQYNTAIQQITAQEQGEAVELIGVLKECYNLKNYPVIWGWIGPVMICVFGAMFVAGLVMLFEDW